MKKILIGLGVLVLIVALGVFWVLGSLDGIVKKQIEVVGTELTGTAVTVGGVGIKLTEGSGEITGLTVANPKGYQADHAFKMNLLRLGLDLESIGKSPLVLNELVIDAPMVQMEMNEKGGSNLKEISDSVSANSAAADAEGSKSQPSAGGEPLRIRIRKLVIKDVGYVVQTPVQKLDNVSGTLPAISLNDVGGAQGATPGEIGKIVIGDLAGRVMKQAAQAGIKSAAEQKLKEAAGGGVGDKLKGLLK